MDVGAVIGECHRTTIVTDVMVRNVWNVLEILEMRWKLVDVFD